MAIKPGGTPLHANDMQSRAMQSRQARYGRTSGKRCTSINGPEDDTWEPIEHLAGAKEYVARLINPYVLYCREREGQA